MKTLAINNIIGIEFDNKNYFGLVLETPDCNTVVIRQLAGYPVVINLQNANSYGRISKDIYKTFCENITLTQQKNLEEILKQANKDD